LTWRVHTLPGSCIRLGRSLRITLGRKRQAVEGMGTVFEITLSSFNTFITNNAPTMSEKDEQLFSDARNYVTEIFTKQVKAHFVFHTLEHTEDVVEACSIMAEHHRLSYDDRLVLLLSAWFHDTGYLKGEPVGHEDESTRIATEFLQRHGVDETISSRVASSIQATKMPQSPVSLVEQILCDADLYHLATEDFKARNALLKQEQEAVFGHKIPKKEWKKNNIEFLVNHKYFTDYGQEFLEPKKLENLNDLKGKKERKEEEKKIEEEELFPYVYEQPVLDPKKDNRMQQKNAERGVQTMFRTTSSNHFELSSLADSKANIMISVNTIIISVVLTVLIARLPFYPQYIIPTTILLVVCLVSVIFAILSTRPSINHGTFTEEDIRNKKTNLLFFGNFHKMKLTEYQWAMNEMLRDKEYLYNSMIKDIYFLGVVLAKKYRYLRIAYTIFMWGLITAVLAFAIVAIFGNVFLPTSTTTTVIDY
jgi:HD superfamily phosphodiesterase